MFLIMGLPRSRTAWLSRFLTYGDWFCGHDELRHMRSLQDVRSWLAQPCTGTVETNAAPWWRLAQKYAPDAKIVVVRRPIDEIVDSMRRVSATADRAQICRLDRKLEQIERRIEGVLSVTFADLTREEVCAKVFEHCLPYPHDPAWWAQMDRTNVQIHMPALVRYVEAYRPQLDKLAAQATQQVRSALMSRRTVEPDGITLQTEPFDKVYADAVELFREHLTQTDQHPNDYLKKNVPLLRKLDGLGCLQLITARSNGRIFGYLLSVITPSLDDPNITSAAQTTFFASKEFPGLGLKMQRESIARVRERGVNEVQFRAGVRGDGPHMDALYRRVGAKEFGQLFQLNLNGE